MDKQTAHSLRERGVTHVGLAWYEAESYEQVVALMKDRHTLAGTHAEWQRRALVAEQQLSREGFVTVRVVLRPAEFSDFCHRHGLDIDANARQHFASVRAAQVQREAEAGGT